MENNNKSQSVEYDPRVANYVLKNSAHPDIDPVCLEQEVREIIKIEQERAEQGGLEEGDECPECGDGLLEYPPVEDCECHLYPPCSACVDNKLTCPECGHEYEDGIA